MRLFSSAALFSLLAVGCADDATSDTNAIPGDDSGSETLPDTNGADTTDAGAQADAGETLAVPEFGPDSSRRFVAYASTDDGLMRPRDLQFDPEAPQNLWIASQDNDGIVILFDAATDTQRSELFLDAFRDHFMEEVSSLAFGAAGTFGTCQESRNTYNNQAPPNDFMGPALWSSNLNVFAAVFQNPFDPFNLGSHLDMLHESPDCMGIEHYDDNQYYVFDGHNGNLVFYDFQVDHGPGQDDHSDGIIRRFPEVELTRVPDVPGHLVYDEVSNTLYIADTGAGRVIAFEPESGDFVQDLPFTEEVVLEYSEYADANWQVFADDLSRPSGIAFRDNRLFVGDHDTGEIIAYNATTGEELGRLDTGAGELMGIEIAPDGKLWFVDAEFDEVIRVEF
jgi:hypothetical protein